MLFEKFIHVLIVLSSSITLVSKLLRLTHTLDELQYSQNTAWWKLFPEVQQQFHPGHWWNQILDLA